MKSKRVSFGYEDTDQKIEVEFFGLIFEINKKNIMNKDIKDINENDENSVEKEIKEIIGEDSIEKINNRRIKDGYDKMTLDVEVAVLTCIYKSYIQATSGSMIDDILKTSKEMENRVIGFEGMNREQRRNYNRNKYRGNRRNYRRY